LKGIKHLTCKYEWLPRVPEPKQCPGCKQPIRNEEILAVDIHPFTLSDRRKEELNAKIFWGYDVIHESWMKELLNKE
jgi:hypothetical protein